VRTYNSMTKNYMRVSDWVRRVHYQFMLGVVKLISAGPSGPHALHQGRESTCSTAFYALQTMLIIPLTLVFYIPFLVGCGILWHRFTRELVTSHTPSDVLYFLMLMILADNQMVSYNHLTLVRGFFPYFNPLEFPRRILSFIRRRILAPMVATGKGFAHYANLLQEFIYVHLKVLIAALSKSISSAAFFVYNLVKQGLIALWKGTVFAFNKIVKRLILALAAAYFWPFVFLLRAMKPLGILGELIFTLFGLAWLLWPMYAAYRLGQREYWVGATVLTLVLILRGRKLIANN